VRAGCGLKIAQQFSFEFAGGDFGGAGGDFLLARFLETQFAKPHRPIAQAHRRTEDTARNGARRIEIA
jgi:hypothetical protein